VFPIVTIMMLASMRTSLPLPRSLQITRGGQGLITFLDLTRAGGMRVCVTLGGACSTLEQWCGGSNCRVAFFSMSTQCCPQQRVHTELPDWPEPDEESEAEPPLSDYDGEGSWEVSYVT
jgi:hypothetical protein